MDLSSFTGEASNIAFEKYNVDSNLSAKVLGFPLAIATDIGTSIWNSLTTEKYNYSTEEVLGKINENALNIYNENENTVKALSFVGGLLLPQGVALKGMKFLRSGAKGANWFSEAGQVARLGEIKTAYENAGRVSDLARTLTWENRFAAAGNALVDSTVLEGTMLLTMNAHPYMEDYIKDPWKNAGLGIAFGTGLIGLGNIAMANRAMKLEAMGVSTKANTILLEGHKAVGPTLNLSDQLAIHQNNIANWENLLITRGDTLDVHTKELIRFNILSSNAKKAETFKSMLSEDTGKMSEEWKALHEGRIASDSDRFAGIDHITFPVIEDIIDLNKANKHGQIFDSTVKPGNVIPLTKDIEDVRSPSAVVYSPKMDKFMTKSDLQYYGTAVDLGYTTEKALMAGVKDLAHFIPNVDIGLETLSSTGPFLDANFLRGLSYFSTRPIAEFQGAKIAADDFGMLQGLSSRLQQETFMGTVPADFSLNLVTHTGVSRKINADQLYEYLLRAKNGETQTMLKNGIPEEIISRYLNVPTDTIQALQAGAPVASPELKWSIYTDPTKIAEYLNPNNRAVVFHTNANKIPHAEYRVNHGIRMSQNTDDVVKEAMLNGSNSSFIQKWSDFFLGPDFRTKRDFIRDKLSLVSNASMGMRFGTSADMAMRYMEELGPVFTSIGKDIISLGNKATDELFSGLKENLISIARNDAARVEYNTALNINAGIKGYRTYKDGQFFVPSATEPGKMEAVKYLGQEFQIRTPVVMDVFDTHVKIGRELYAQANTIRKISGASPISDIGLWIPSFNPKGKFISYAIDKSTQTTTLLYGKTAGEMEDAIRAFGGLPGVTVGQTHDIVRHGIEQKLYNAAAGRHDPMFMTSANTSMLHTGSSMTSRVDTSTGPLTDIVSAYEHQLNYNIRNITELMLSDVMDYLKTASSYAQAAMSNQPVGKIGALLSQPKDAAATVMNTILGKSGLEQNTLWSGVNTFYGAVAEKSLRTIASVMEPVLNTVRGKIGRGQGLSDIKYEELAAELKAKGIPNPFAAFEEAEQRRLFHSDRTRSSENLAPRLTVLANTMAATSLLKVLELGQPYVNAISLPILMTSEISSKLPAQYMGAAISSDAHLGVIKTMFNGWRYAHADVAKPYMDYGIANGLFKGVISEADELFKQTRSIEGGVISKVENAMQSNIVNILSKPAEYSESMVREKAFATGVYIAKTSYPDLHDAGVITFARDFMDRTIGNYTAAQRPTMFQGTLGVAMGLFQTYMVTIAQSMYRHLEKGEFKALAKTMLAQGGIFGARALPGFNMVSEAIGNHFSDNNVDLSTGTFRALPDQMAETALYGLSSSFGPAVTTRGDIQPRLPDPTQGLIMIPAINLTTQAFDAMKKVAKALFTADENAGRGMMEALSMQSISRPLARMSELAGGYATTSKGNVVGTPEEVWTWPSAFARVLATRPIAEVRIRDMMHLDSVYGTADKKNREDITERLKTHIRQGSLDPEVVSRLGEEYMRTGSPTGWNSIVNTAIAQTQDPINETVRRYLNPHNSSLMTMIDNMH